jgi:hypothetical protein
MGAIYISNCNNNFIHVQKRAVQLGFSEKKINKENELNFLYYPKIISKNKQLYFSSNNDFLLFTGSVISLKDNANWLECLFNSFHGDINTIKDNTIGVYCCVLKKNNITYIFGDNSGTYDLFYRTNQSRIEISTCLDFLKTKNTLFNELALNELALTSSIFGNDTELENCFRLSSNKYIYYSDNNFQIKENKIVSLETRNQSYENRLVTLAKRFYNSKKISIYFTGGLDSRLVLSAALKSTADIDLVSGEGVSFITNTKKRDRDISKNIAKNKSLNLKEISWNDSSIDIHNWGSVLKNYGIKAFFLYGGNENIILSFLNNKTDVLEFGYFGETLRNLSDLEEEITLDYYLKKYYFKENSLDIINTTKLYNYVYQKHLIYCQSHSINPISLTSLNVAELNFKFRVSADSTLCNFLNRYIEVFNILGDSKLVEIAISKNFKFKKDGGFVKSIIAKLSPELSREIFFSHLNEIDKSKNKLDYLKPLIRSLLFKIKFTKKIVYNLKFNNYSPVNKNIIRVLISYIIKNKDNNLKNQYLKNIAPYKLLKLVQIIYLKKT